MANFFSTWQKVSFAAPNRRKTPHIKGKKCTQKNIYPNAADFQLKKEENRKKRRKNETHSRPLVLQHPRPVSLLVFFGFSHRSGDFFYSDKMTPILG
jgi:hypothetical protein